MKKWCQFDGTNYQYHLIGFVSYNKIRYAKYWLALVVHHEHTYKNNGKKLRESKTVATIIYLKSANAKKARCLKFDLNSRFEIWDIMSELTNQIMDL